MKYYPACCGGEYQFVVETIDINTGVFTIDAPE